MNIFDIIGATIGLFYIVSEYRADRWFWPLSLLMSAFYAVIEFVAGYYANGSICIYNFIMSVYGLLVWRGVLSPSTRPHQPQAAATPSNLEGEQDGHFYSSPKLGEGNPSVARVEECDRERKITSCPRRYWWQIILATVLLSIAFWFLLIHLPNESNHPVIDGISSALNIVGMLMLAQKWWQQWFCWLLVEPMMIYLFQSSGNYASVILYIVFEVFVIMGIIRWRKEALKQ